MTGGKWKWTVSGYASNGHPSYPLISFGNLLLTTTHANDVSKDVEVSAWQSRMAKGHVAYIIVTNLWEGGSETIYPTGKEVALDRA
jgi:hypothetical protein